MPRNPPLPWLFLQAAGVTFQLPREGTSGLSFCCVLPPSLLSSVVFPCWFPGCFLEARSAQLPLRPSEGLAEVVVSHLLVAVRFPPTREGSGTKCSGRRPKNRASFRYPPRYLVRSRVLPYLFTCGMFWVFGSFRLPAVTSASEVLTRAFVEITWARAESYCRTELGRSHSQSQVVFGGDPVDPTRAHFRTHRCANRRCFSSSVSRTNCGNRIHTLRSGFQQHVVDRFSTFTYHMWWKKSWKEFSESRRLVVCTEINLDSQRNWALRVFRKFPRASSSSAGRLRQVAADRARAGEKFLMAHFPASLSMSRLARSSGTQKVCETTKSRNRTEAGAGAKVARTTRPPTRRHYFTVSLCARRPKCQDDHRTVADARSNDPVRSQASSENEAAYHEAAGVRSLVLALSLLELIASSPPSRPRFGTIHGGFQQIATTAIVPFNPDSVPARAPTRELEGTPRGRGRSRKRFHKFWDFGSLFVP